MASTDQQPHGRPSRKLTKKRREQRRVSMDIPERFRDGDDAQDDVTAPKRKDALSMNQSLFSMIARASQSSHTELSAMREAESGDESDADERRRRPTYRGLDGAARLSRISTSNVFEAPSDDKSAPRIRHRRDLSDHKLMRSLPKLKLSRKHQGKAEDQPADRITSSQLLPRQSSESKPVTAQPHAIASKHKSEHDDTEDTDTDGGNRRPPHKRSTSGISSSTSKSKGPATLAKRLQQIFEFEELEEVVSEYPCWLLQSALVQGYMYITQKHICFYAYIPKRHNDTSKTGYLSKRGRSKYNRYWFILRGDVLAYYSNPAELYFPRNRINLQYAISAEVVETKDKNKEETTFLVTTDERTYKFKADSAMSAKEWVRSIQKVIFRTHNDGNRVKISLPIQNVLEIEESTILDFTDTIKVRVIDNDETYAIDEYFFSFFSHGQDALNVLNIMVNDNEHHQQNIEQALTSTPMDNTSQVPGSGDGLLDPPQITENVRATLSPLPGAHVGRSRVTMDSARSSFDTSRDSQDARRSTEINRSQRRRSYGARRSFSSNRPDTNLEAVSDRSPQSMNLQHSRESSSVAVQSIDESNVSASQILGGSDVFRTHSPHAATGISQETVPSRSEKSQAHARSGATTPSHGNHGAVGSPKPIASDNEADPHHPANRLSASTSTLHNIASYPLQKASGLAGFLRNRSKRVSGLLATESMGYYEKVSGMLAGGRKHYHTGDAPAMDGDGRQYEDDEDAAKAAENFREHFALPETEQLQSTYFASLQRILPNYGKIYISDHYFCFRSLVPTSKLKIILPMRDIETVNKEKGFRLGYHGLVVVIRGHEEVFFEFSRAEFRDECTIGMLRILESVRYVEGEGTGSSDYDSDDEAARAELDLLRDARRETQAPETPDLSEVVRSDHDRVPLIFDDPLASIVDFKPQKSLRIVCLTIGSRGDVQPYIALCKELIKEGHRPLIATHAEFEGWVQKHGIDFAPVDGNPAELMRICVEHGMFTFNFLKEANAKFRGWLDSVCSSAWKASQGADVLIESPSAMAGIHIAEALEIPYFRAFTMPWTRTRTYPHAFSVFPKKMGGGYNSVTYTAFDTIFWTAIAGQINNWRRRELGLPGTSQSKMQANLRPFLYNFSPSVVPPPLDWPDWIRVTGYWFLSEGDNYEPPADLLAFMEKARADKKKLVYVGFGSIVIDDPAALTKTVVDSVLKADVRCVLSKGWSDRLETKDASKTEVPLPPEIFQIQSAPHDWLFKQMDAAVHHGGAGTTGASLRAGIPTIIKPFFGDQYFYAQRVEDLGVGVWLRKVNTSVFSRALWEVTNSHRVIVKAKVLGQKIRKENGTQVAIQTIYRELDRAKALIKKHEKRDMEADDDEEEEDWTFVDDDQAFDVSQPFEFREPVTGMKQAPIDSSQTGSGSMAMASMAFKGARESLDEKDRRRG